MESINLTVCFPNKRHLNDFVNILAWMELCGNTGHCTDFIITMDGDGSARPKFIFDNEKLQEAFNRLKREYEKEEFRTIPNVRKYLNADVMFNIS